MKRILIDMDDVMADTGQKVIDMINEQTGTSFSKENVSASHELLKEFERAYMKLRPQIFEKGFFLDIPVMEDAQEVVKKLHEKYEIFIVSAANEFPLSLSEKLEWLDKYFPYIGWQYTVFCGHKWMIQADYLIDDHPKNLIKFAGQGILFDAVHNQKETDYHRVNSWKEIESFLL